MKTLLLNLCFLLFLIISCNKAPEEIQANPTNPLTPANAFTKVYLFGGPGNWGGSVCGFGWVMIREDSSSIVYHSMNLPVTLPLPSNPVWANIKYHDTINFTYCYDEIIVDSLKF